MTTRTNRIIISLSLVKKANPTVTINSWDWEYALVYKRCVQDRARFERPLNVVAVGESQVGIVEIFLVNFLLY